MILLKKALTWWSLEIDSNEKFILTLKYTNHKGYGLLNDNEILRLYLIKKVKFPNGFRSWMETFAEVYEFITLERQKPSLKGVMKEVQEQSGTCGFYDLAQEWTAEFEAIYFKREWDGEFFEEVEEFCKKKNFK